MRRATILFAVLAILMIPAAALATPPEVIAEEDFAYPTFVEPDMTEYCGFDVSLAVEGSFKATVFSDKDGVPIRERIHESGRTLWSSADGEVWERYVVNVDIDFAAGTETIKGNVWNAHAGAGGILVNDSGRIVFVPPDYDNAITINGPHQAYFGEFDALCEALAP